MSSTLFLILTLSAVWTYLQVDPLGILQSVVHSSEIAHSHEIRAPEAVRCSEPHNLAPDEIWTKNADLPNIISFKFPCPPAIPRYFDRELCKIYMVVTYRARRAEIKKGK